MGSNLLSKFQLKGFELDVHRNLKSSAEEFFLNRSELKEEQFSDGEILKFRILIARYSFLENLEDLKNLSICRVAIFIPGLFDDSFPNFGNHVVESKLSESMILGDSNFLISIKPEGLTEESYMTDKPTERLVANFAVERIADFITQVRLLNSKIKFDFRVTGYSEGSALGASIVATLSEKSKESASPLYGVSISCFDSIGAGGLLEFGKATNLVSITKNYFRTVFRGLFKHVEIDGINLDCKELRELENELGRAKVSILDDFFNIFLWFVRLNQKLKPFFFFFLKHIYKKNGLDLERVNSQITNNPVPSNRVLAVGSYNTDFEKILSYGIDMRVIFNKKDQLFVSYYVAENIKGLYKNGGNLLVFVLNGNHQFEHDNPSAIAYMLKYYGVQKGVGEWKLKD